MSMRARCSPIAASSRATTVMGPPRTADPYKVDQKSPHQSVGGPINRRPRPDRTRARISRMHVLDNPVWHALTGAHASLAERVGSAARYHADVAVFSALDDDASPAAWSDLRDL